MSPSRTPSVADRAHEFARSHFPGCAVHSEEAAAVFTTIEALNRGPIGSPDPDLPLAQLVPDIARTAPSEGDSLDALECRMAIEAELGPSELTALAVAELADESVV